MENYSIMDEIGRGTHSFVYKARRKRSIQYVAVKSTAKSRMDKVREACEPASRSFKSDAAACYRS